MFVKTHTLFSLDYLAIVCDMAEILARVPTRYRKQRKPLNNIVNANNEQPQAPTQPERATEITTTSSDRFPVKESRWSKLGQREIKEQASNDLELFDFEVPLERPTLQVNTAGLNKFDNNSINNTPSEQFYTANSYQGREVRTSISDNNPLSALSFQSSSDAGGGQRDSRESDSITSIDSTSITSIKQNIINSIPISFKLPTQTIIREVSENSTIVEILKSLISDHRYELAEGYDEYMLWEVCPRLRIRRPIRSHEYIKHVRASWESANQSQNFIEVGSSNKRLDVSSIAFLNPRRDLLNKEHGPSFNGKMYYWKNQSDWKKCKIDIHNGNLTISKRDGSKDSRVLTINEFDLYENFTKLHGQPASHAIIIRSQQSPDFFMDKSDSVHFFAMDDGQDYELLRNILYSLRSQTVDRVSRNYAQALKDEVINNSVIDDEKSNKSAISSNKIRTRTKSTTRTKIPSRKLVQIANDEMVDSIPLSKLTLESQYKATPILAAHSEIKPDGLLGKSYAKKIAAAQQTFQQSQLPSTQQFVPNSLLASPVALLNSGGKQFEARGLMGRTYSVRQPRRAPPTRKYTK